MTQARFGGLFLWKGTKMIPTYATYTNISGGVSEAGRFNIAATPMMFYQLMSGIAKDKIRYVIQELGNNAWDVARGNFEVNLPGHFSRHFSIRDYGTGLSHEDIVTVYTTFGDSTKLNTNDTIGHKGLGAKSPFAYLIGGSSIGTGAAAFTVRSFHEGRVRTYIMSISEQGYPKWELVADEPTEERPGIEVSFPVRVSDVAAFRSTAMEVFWAFNPRPQIVPDLDWVTPNVIQADPDGKWRYYDSASVPFRQPMVRMGSLMLPIDISQVVSDTLPWPWRRLPILFEAPIGSLSLTTSNEELGYDANTKAALKTLIQSFEDAIIKDFQSQIDACPHFIDACLKYTELTMQYDSQGRNYIHKRVAFNGLQLRHSMLSWDKSIFRACIIVADEKGSISGEFDALASPSRRDTTVNLRLDQLKDVKHILIEKRFNFSNLKVQNLAAAGKFGSHDRILWIRSTEMDRALRSFGIDINDLRIIDLDKIKIARNPGLPLGQKRPKNLVRRKIMLMNGDVSEGIIDINTPGICIIDADAGSGRRYRSYSFGPGQGSSSKETCRKTFENLHKLGVIEDGTEFLLVKPDFSDVPVGWKYFSQAMVKKALPKLDIKLVSKHLGETSGKLTDGASRLERNVEQILTKVPVMPSNLRELCRKLLAYKTEKATISSDETASRHHWLYTQLRNWDPNITIPVIGTPSLAEEALNAEFEAITEEYQLLSHFLNNAGYYWSHDMSKITYYLKLEADLQSTLNRNAA